MAQSTHLKTLTSKLAFQRTLPLITSHMTHAAPFVYLGLDARSSRLLISLDSSAATTRNNGIHVPGLKQVAACSERASFTYSQ
jgi:hypothetical protein